MLVPLLLAGTIVVGPFMGMQWAFSMPNNANGHVVRVLTCNIQTGNIDCKALSQLIREKNVDLVALQECPPSLQLDLPPGWQMIQTGILAILSRYSIQAHEPIMAPHPPHVWPRHSLLPCSVTTPEGEFIFGSMYLPSPRYGLQHILDRAIGINPRKADLLVAETENRQKVSELVRNSLKFRESPLIIAGDFNMPVESNIYQTYWSEFSNAFAEKSFGYGWTYRDYAYGIPINLRIDHVLTTNGAHPLQCFVEKYIGSDHRPVISDIYISRIK